jgi:hypothetical protein
MQIVVPVLLLAFVVIYKLDREYYIYLTLEDNVVEWATFGFLLVSGVLALFLARSLLQDAKALYPLFRGLWSFLRRVCP